MDSDAEGTATVSYRNVVAQARRMMGGDEMLICWFSNAIGIEAAQADLLGKRVCCHFGIGPRSARNVDSSSVNLFGGQLSTNVSGVPSKYRRAVEDSFWQSAEVLNLVKNQNSVETADR